MSEQHYSVLEAFDPEARQAQAELDAYFASRPFKDEQGLVRAPDGTFANADTYFDNRRQELEIEGVESYESMSLPTLARKLAQAEIDDDETSVIDISDVLIEKLSAQSDVIRSSRDSEHNADREDNLWDRIMNIKQAEKERLMSELMTELQAEQEVPETQEPEAEEPEEVEELEEPEETEEASEPEEEPDDPVNPEVAEEYGFNIGHAYKIDKDEDRVVINHASALFAVVDGMGGHAAGAVAAESIADGLNGYWSKRHLDTHIDETNAAWLMKESINTAQQGLSEALENGEGAAGMGAVATQIKFFTDSDGSLRFVYGHVGDTRLYVQDASGEEIKLITRDECNPLQPNMVTNCFIAGHSSKVQALQIGISEPLNHGTRIMLCTDGITGDTEAQQISNNDMKDAFETSDVQHAAEKLLDVSTKPDDGNVVFIEVTVDIEPTAEDPIWSGPTPAPTAEPKTIVEPSEAARPVTRQQRAKNLMANWYKQGRERVSRKKAVAALVVGALALGGFALHEANESENDKDTKSRVNTAPSVTPAPSVQPTAVARAVEAHAAKTVKLKHGDTVWNEVEAKLKGSSAMAPTNAQILQETNRILRLNHMTWEQARHLDDDTEIQTA